MTLGLTSVNKHGGFLFRFVLFWDTARYKLPASLKPAANKRQRQRQICCWVNFLACGCIVCVWLGLCCVANTVYNASWFMSEPSSIQAALGHLRRGDGWRHAGDRQGPEGLGLIEERRFDGARVVNLCLDVWRINFRRGHQGERNIFGGLNEPMRTNTFFAPLLQTENLPINYPLHHSVTIF